MQNKRVFTDYFASSLQTITISQHFYLMALHPQPTHAKHNTKQGS